MRKKMMFLAWLWLVATGAFGQMFEVNSPTSETLNEVISYSADGSNYETYIFGNNGFMAASFDKAASWQIKVVDEQKRNIKSALRMTGGGLIILGDNGLLKYAAKEGGEFSDIILTGQNEVMAAAIYKDSLIVFAHRSNGLSVWSPRSKSFFKIDYNIMFSNVTVMGVGCSGSKIFVWGNRGTGSSKQGVIFYYEFFDSSWNNLSLALQNAGLLSMGMRDWFPDNPIMAYAIKFLGSNGLAEIRRGAPGTVNGSSFWLPPSNYYNVNFLSVNWFIKSTLYTPFNGVVWHVGVEDSDKGFIAKNSEVMKYDFAVNEIDYCGQYFLGTGSVPKVIAVGAKGKILSNDFNLKAANSTNSLKDDYVVSDTTVFLYDKATVFVSGSEIGVNYRVVRDRDEKQITSFAGTGSAWSFITEVIEFSENYSIIASRDNVSVSLKDKAQIQMMLKNDYAVTCNEVRAGEKAVIQISGSQIGVIYHYVYIINDVFFRGQMDGTGGPISFEINPTESVEVTVGCVKISWNDEYITGRLVNANPIYVKVTPLSVREVDLKVLSAYPNPCQDDLFVFSSDYKERVVLSDISGRVIQQFVLEMGQNTISMLGLRPGIYFLSTDRNVFKVINY